MLLIEFGLKNHNIDFTMKCVMYVYSLNLNKSYDISLNMIFTINMIKRCLDTEY